MSLRDGIVINSYTDLTKHDTAMLLFEPNGDRTFSFNTMYSCPGMVNIETGERFYSEDIEKYIRFPLHRVKLIAYIEEKE